jgi:predicted nicotinamide N-methyase
MDREPLDILADAFYNRGVDHEETDAVAQEVLDELSAAGYVLVYSPRRAELPHVNRQKFHNGIPV